MSKLATLYRIHTTEHISPYGLKSLDLLKRQDNEVDGHRLTSKEETDNLIQKHDVKTTPQTFIDCIRMGGYDDLKNIFGKAKDASKKTTYIPVIAIFSTALLMTAALSWNRRQGTNVLYVLETCIALSMCALVIQKLRDLSVCSLQFISYDLLAMRCVRYAVYLCAIRRFSGTGLLTGTAP